MNKTKRKIKMQDDDIGIMQRIAAKEKIRYD